MTAAQGSLEILNVGAGDLKLSFDPTQPVERDHARTVVMDMLRRGYAILVQVDTKDGEPVYQRAKDFDPTTAEYIIMGVPPPETENVRETDSRKREVRIPAETTRAIAVPRSAGG